MRLAEYKHLTIDKKRPVVFLDIDGVFNGGFQHEHLFDLYEQEEIIERPSHKGDYLLSSIVKPVCALFRRHRVQVVVVSSWFQSNVGPGHPQVEELRSLMRIDVIGSLHTGGGEARGEAVGDCVKALRLKHWVVVDDCAHFYCDERIPIGRLVISSGRYGMQPQDIQTLSLLLDSFTA